MTEQHDEPVEVTLPDDGWLIYKAGRGWYRPNAQGYTASPAEAGRYSRSEALSYSHPNGLDGPRDGMSIKHESEVPGATRPTPSSDMVEAMARAMFTADRVCREHDWGNAHEVTRMHFRSFAQAATTVIAEAMAAKDAELAELRAESEALRGALQDVVNPIAKFKREADAVGARLDGQVAYAMSRDADFIKSIARAALGSAEG